MINEKTAAPAYRREAIHAPAFATTVEAASFMRLSKAMVNKMVADGRIPCQRFGRAVRISWKWLREQE